MELDTVAKIRRAFYRLVGSTPDDDALTELGESENDVAHLYLTEGVREAQLYMIDWGHAPDRWRSRSGAIATADWLGNEADDGGRWVELDPTVGDDVLRLWSDRTAQRRRSALREADGTPWGREIEEEHSDRLGDFYYLKNRRLWITRNATPPTTVFAEYHHRHPPIDDTLADADIDFPMDARRLIVAEAAYAASDESWLPGGPEMEAKIERARTKARMKAKAVARRTRTPNRMDKPARLANHW